MLTEIGGLCFAGKKEMCEGESLHEQMKSLQANDRDLH